MKVSAHPLIAPATSIDKSVWTVYAELFKARLTFLVLITTLVGFYLGSRGAVDYLSMFHTVLGTALVASGASALNQLFEREYDSRMRRTADRPLPSGRLQPQFVLWVGVSCALSGLLPTPALLSALRDNRTVATETRPEHRHLAGTGLSARDR